MNEQDILRTRLRGLIARLRKTAADVGPMHSAWEDIHDLEALLRALEWQPIESAPRDGTVILGAIEWSPGQWEYAAIWWGEGGWDDGDYNIAGRPAPSHWKMITPPSGSKP